VLCVTDRRRAPGVLPVTSEWWSQSVVRLRALREDRVVDFPVSADPDVRGDTEVSEISVFRQSG